MKIQVLSADSIGSPIHEKMPRTYWLLVDLKQVNSDIDIIIGAHRQVQAVNATIDNYSLLERDSKLHFLVVESSRDLRNFLKIRNQANVSKIFILNELRCASKRYEPRFYGSNGAAVAAHVGLHYSEAPCAFFSHSDMMGYKENFLSFLRSKLSEKTPIASFTQRHILPFSGGMLFKKNILNLSTVNWFPSEINPYKFPGIEELKTEIEVLNWLDAGEQFILEALQEGYSAYVCASRGLTGDFYGHPLRDYSITHRDISNLGVPIEYATDTLSREDFLSRYPHLAPKEVSMWRKSFDDDGNLVFIHRGRGTTKGSRVDGRGDFVDFVCNFNRNFSGT